MKAMKTVLVTGSNGYIGRHVVRALKRRGARVVCVDRTIDPSCGGDACYSADLLDGDIALVDLIGEVPDACIHLAWRNGFDHNDPSHLLDLSAHFSFLSGLASAGVRQIAAMGSMHEIGYWEGAIDEETPCNPLSLYGVSKNALREALLLTFANSPIVFQWIRAFYLFGDDANAQSVFGKISRAAAEGRRSFPFTSGRNQYDFLEVDELAEQIAAVLMQDEVDGVINCCSGVPISLGEKVEGYIADNGFDITLDYGAFPDRPYDSPALWGDPAKIRAILAAEDGE